MRFLTDDRSQAIQIGAVLIFGILIVFLALYQGFVVPDQNEEIEFNHNQELQSEMTDMRSTAISMPGQTTTQSVSLGLGVRYPSRAIFVNPGPASGTLQTSGTTSEAVNLTIENATADGNVGDFWNGTAHSYNTGTIEYRPGYNLFATAPRTVYEHSVVYNDFGANTTLSITDQAMVRDDRITLVMLNGSFSESRVDRTSVDFEPVSTNTRTVEISGTESDPVTISAPTQMNESEWEEVFDEGDNATVSTESIAGSEYQMLEIELEEGTYDLQLAKVGIGTEITGTDAAYLTDISGNGTTIQRGQTQTLELEVRDEFNNPVGGVSVEGSPEGGSFTGDSTQQTDDEGRATFEYRGTSSGTHQINFTTDSASGLDGSHDGSSPENVTMTVTVESPSGSGVGGSAYNVSWEEPSGPAIEYDSEENIYEYNATVSSELELTMETDPNADGANVEYAVEDQDVGMLNPGSGMTSAEGTHTTTFEPRSAGEVNLYTSSGDDGDRLRLNVTDVQADALTVDPDQANIAAVHNWSFDDVPFEGEVDEIEAAYPDGTSFDGLDQDDITVKITRDGEQEPTEIDVNTDTYSGSTATFDLDGTFNTDIDGPVIVEIDGLENPDVGNYDATLTFSGDEDTFSSIQPFDIGEFNVSIDDVDDEVTAGDPVSVDYTIENTGSQQTTQDIEFRVDDDLEETESDVELTGGDTFSGTFTYTTDEGDTPEITVEVASDNDADSATVTVNEDDSEADFEVAINSTNSPVVQGDEMVFDVDVTNTGDAEDTQDITLGIDGVGEVDDEEITLTSGEDGSVELVWDTAADQEPDEYTAVVGSEDDNTDSRTVEVLPPADFDVEIDEDASDTEVTEGESATIIADITNEDDYEDTQDIEFEVTDEDGNTLDTQTQELTLGPGASDDVEFTYQIEEGDAPEVTAIVRSETDEDEIDVTVAEAEPQIIDDFEDDDLDSRYSGDTTDFEIVADDAVQGENRLEAEGPNQDPIGIITSSPGDGLEYYPERGDTIRFNVQLEGNNVDTEFLFGGTDASNTYGVRLNNDDNTFELNLDGKSDSEGIELDSSEVDFDRGEWYEVEIQWGEDETDDTITVVLFDEEGTEVTQLQADDSTYDDGLVGFTVAGNNQDAFFDFVRVV